MLMRSGINKSNQDVFVYGDAQMGLLSSRLNTLSPIILQNKQKTFLIKKTFLKLITTNLIGEGLMNVGALESINGERNLSGIINNSIKTRRSVFYRLIWDQILYLCSICHLHFSTVTSSGAQSKSSP